MIAKDNIYIPFPGIGQTSSLIGLIVSYEKHITGCNKAKCPCRVWPQCSYYNKMKLKKSREDDDRHIAEIRKWYDIHFRIKYETPDVLPNG